MLISALLIAQPNRTLRIAVIPRHEQVSRGLNPAEASYPSGGGLYWPPERVCAELAIATAGLKQGVGRMLLSPAYSKCPVTRPLPTKDGVVLRTLRDARDYMLALPEGSWRREQWQITAPNSSSKSGMLRR